MAVERSDLSRSWDLRGETPPIRIRRRTTIEVHRTVHQHWLVLKPLRSQEMELESTIKSFASDADLETARTIAEKFAVAGIHVRSIGKEVLESLDSGGLSASIYEKLARLCHNRNGDLRGKVAMAKELSNSLFRCVIQPSK